MSKNKLIAGVDVGSSSIKWAVYDLEDMELLRAGNVRYPKGTFEKDNVNVDVVADTYLHILNILDKMEVSYVGMSTMAPILICMNSEKIALTGIPYNSLLGAEFLSDLDADASRDTTLNVPNVQFFYQKIKWIKKNATNIFTATRWLVDLNGFLLEKLENTKNRPVQDINTALEWGLLNYKTMTWEPSIVMELGIENRLPELVQPEYSCKYRNMVVSIGTVDTIVSALGSIGTDSNKFFITNGSTLCAGYVSRTPVKSNTLYNDLYFQGKYLINGCNSQYSTILDWAESNFKRSIDVNRIDMNPRAITFLPYLEGERCPIFNTEIRAGFYGIDKWSTNDDMIAAIVHSMAYLSVDMIENLMMSNEGEHHFNGIIAGGGMSKVNIGSIVATLTNLRYEITGIEPTTLGACLISMKGNGIIDNYSTGKYHLLKIEQKIKPDTSILTHKISYDRFKKFRDSTLRTLSDLNNSADILH
jgi:sugar (pentulose or hexulose) kinase